MMSTAIGRPTGGKAINLHQLEAELRAVGTASSAGLGQEGEYVYTYTAAGAPCDFPADQQSTVDQVIDSHIAMRDKTDAELAAEFQAATEPARRQEIRDMQAGLLPREQVPMT